MCVSKRIYIKMTTHTYTHTHCHIIESTRIQGETSHADMLQYTTSSPPKKKHIFFNIYVCMCLLLYIIYMCYSIYGYVLTYQKLPFLGAFLTFQNHTQKLRALLNRNSACQMLCSVTQILFSPQDYPPSCWVFYKQMVLSIILFSCSGSHSSCEWQLYIQ